jgi:hypothetical protein
MIDNPTVLITCGIAIFTAWRALRLNAMLPWFPPSAALAPKIWRRTGR